MKFLNHSQLRRNKKFHLALLLFAGIFGILFFTFLKEKIIIIPSENISETKHWKTYSNSEFKFSFKYPEGLLSNFSEDVNGKNTGELLNLVKEIKIQNSKTSNSSYQYNVHFGADAWKYEGQLEEFIQTNLKETENLKRQKVRLSDYEFQNRVGCLFCI